MKKDFKYHDYQRELASMVSKSFDNKRRSVTSVNEELEQKSMPVLKII